MDKEFNELFKLRIDKIKLEGNKLHVKRDSKEFVQALIQRGEIESSLSGNVEVSLAIYKSTDVIVAKGNLKACIVLTCSRCLNKFKKPVDIPLKITLLKKQDFPEDLELTSEDLETGVYEGEEVNFMDFILDHLILAIPYAPLCKPDCKGLCPVCGADLNNEPCSCNTAWIDPRFAILKELKEKIVKKG